MIRCPLSGSTNVKVLYKQNSVPLIQNKVYSTKQEAVEATCVDMILAQSLDNGFVFNAGFDDSIINYDTHYQNEQSNSAYFRKHLENVIDIMQVHKLLNGKVVEIGCGKAYFMEMLLEREVDVIGFDPTYEGDSPRVIKDFFSDKYSDISADFIILRHTLEHIAFPFHFIKTIASANNYKGKIFIEVPTFDWISKHNATEDIFYEHCNYFTLRTLQMLFKKSKGGHFFNGQYIYSIADLKEVNETIERQAVENYIVTFTEQLEKYKTLVGSLKKVAIWGAGAKGSTFLNLVDKEERNIDCVVDINPKKQHHYVGGTGHYIIKPEELKERDIEHIIIMNENYLDEIKEMVGSDSTLILL